MADTFTKVTNVSWFERIKDSFKGIFIGLILFIVSFPLLFWNEGRAIKTAKSLAEGASSVVSITPDKIDPANDRKLVHVTGETATDETLTDPEFGISIKGIHLIREVQMYQWKQNEKRESRKKLGGGEETVTTYSYEKVWEKEIIDSTQFEKASEHSNPTSKPFEDQKWSATNVSLKAFSLSTTLIDMIHNEENFRITDELYGKLPETLKTKLKAFNGMFYSGLDPSNPQISDSKIVFKFVKPGTVSIISKQSQNTFEPYRTSVGGTIEMLEPGSLSAELMFEKAMTQNTIITWFLRLLGFILMYAGLLMFLKPLSVIGDVVPLIGSIIGFGTGLVAGLSTLLLSIITIAIAWLFYRPIIAIPLLIVGIGGLVGLKMLAKGKAAPQKAAA